ncbi:MAG: adenylate/guanylate cyclase domain-containing protein [Kofleriaceae bacterium]|nr:adenylate/guanylate cyclase domain-containing protein [Kofleriaceae bacterium]
MERRRRVLLAQLPLVVLWTLAFLVADCGDDGRLENDFLRTKVYPTLRRMEGFYTDLKFRMRGVDRVQNKIVIVEIDDRAVSELSRWPWHRDAIAYIVHALHEAGAKVVGLDIVFPEPDQRVPDELVELMKANNLGDAVPEFETDLMLQRIIDLGKERLVLGWMSDRVCRPAYDGAACVTPDPAAPLTESFPKFGFTTFSAPGFDPATTPLVSTPAIVGNLPGYDAAAQHAGFLITAAEDPDDVVRRAQLAIFVGGKPHPSLPLEMARVGLGEELALALDGDGHVAKLAFAKSGRALPVGPTGTMSINFRGGGYHFPYVGVIDLLGDQDILPVQHDGIIEPRARKDVFQDAYVLVGVTAMGARDLRHFPFGSNIPGTEGLASILDNILTGDPLRREASLFGTPLLLALMTVGAFGFALLMVRLSALPAMVCSLGIMGLLATLDVIVAFGYSNVDLSSVFLFGELLTIFIATVAVKYVVEERGKKFIRSTFSKYLAPTVVDQMLRDPSKLQLGGETRRLTIMMSDLRGFTSMAERMKPAEVLAVLNHYLGAMADIIVEHNGTIDEFIGDAILVIFGAPIEGKDDARRAVACAIAMQRAMKDINAHNAKLGLPKLEMGIALNTGEVIVGNIGSQKHIKYGVVGSHVNLTARIESNTVGGQVLISGSTLELAGPDVQVGEKQMIVAKGFPEPIPAYEVKAIGGEYNLAIEEVDLALVELPTPVEVRFRVMKGKNEEGDEIVGTLRSISALGGELVTGEVLEPFANLKLRIVGPDGALVEGDLYAKVLVAGPTCRLRFTAVPPTVEKAIAALV